jgi:uncharacterized protein YraI
MKRPACVLAVMLCASARAALAWTTVGVGIEYQSFTTPDPNNLFVARMDRSNPAVTIESSVANGTTIGARETVRNQAARYDDAINWWGQSWGQRNDVIVAINGDFFNGTTGVMSGGWIHSGWYANRFSNFGGYSGFGWTVDRVPFIGGCINHRAEDQFITFIASGNTQRFQGINCSRGSNELIIYTPQYDSNTHTDNTGVEVLVEMNRPDLVLNSPNMSLGYVRQIRQNQGSTYIPFDHVVLSATGSAATTLLNNVAVGAQIGISQKISDYNEPDTAGNNGCNYNTGLDWQMTYAAIGINYRFLEGSQIRPPDPSHSGYAGLIVRNPRTAIAYNSNHVFYVVCDGRSGASVGMTMTELGNFCLNTLGASEGVNLDGGGSSTLVVNGVVKNVPSDGSERAVSNGMMMVNVMPKLQSSAFAVGQAVITNGAANVRLGPGTNYAARSSVASGTAGTVVDHALKGVYAKGYYWWKVDFSGTVGWVAETLLTDGASPPTITQHPSPQTTCPGGLVTFSVAATSPSPMTYRWQKGDADMTDGGHYSGVTTATLTVSDADSTDAASYRCVVSNTHGGATSNGAALTLRQATAIGQQPLPRHVCAPADATFSVTATGDGVLRYQWRKNGADLTDNGHYVGATTAALTIVSAIRSDAADYACAVTGGCGSVTSDPAALTVGAVTGADVDGDCDVDLTDFSVFQMCFNGPNRPLRYQECLSADLDGDADVDLTDFAVFQNCFNGPNRPAACP